jgi:hypothetical protein
LDILVLDLKGWTDSVDRLGDGRRRTGKTGRNNTHLMIVEMRIPPQ